MIIPLEVRSVTARVARAPWLIAERMRIQVGLANMSA